MQLIFAARPGLGSWLIRTFTGSPWSHVAVVDGPTVIEAVPSSGVRRRGLDEFFDAWPTHEVVTVATPDDGAGLAFWRQQLGKPYDGRAWLGFLMPWRDWQDQSAWDCSEGAGATLDAAGLPMPVDAARLSPGMLYDLVRGAR